ncbi:hypothetical protein JOD43_001053 [Pullulanibacillus pueri]|uniref:Elongation factor G-binding protein C-terminal treble-clef zinc-finger domain-containing protein n=1 Tax=Pullulanibacillus pueri TaxID=1437324 RepID=A0A8J3EM01_9BACL|nr:FusB/FusC family EF-G-binding protein [Pullulanibacillus pueri]MBM7680887.1 hypothetical protein [Pullulanibacillus pueri]GGH81214.1 hypothetical protein GCM10007096_18780 [Pullulanibacillus pueri]
MIKGLFPKAKKLKSPSFDDFDLKEHSYISWIDIRANHRKYIIAYYQNKLTGIYGSFDPLQQKGICTLCGKHGEVGLFVAKVKGIRRDMSIKRGNYICQDSLNCNRNLTTLDKLNTFIERLQK